MSTLWPLIIIEFANAACAKIMFCFIILFYLSGNKGGVGVSFEFQGTRLCFVTAHLTSGSERNVRYYFNSFH